MDITFEQINAFKAVAKHKSFSVAAKELYRTQSAVSIQVANLEESIGQKLFHRTTKIVTLTEAGQIFLKCVRGIERTIDETEQELNDLNEMERGRLMISTSDTTACYRIPDILQEYREKYPEISQQYPEDAKLASALYQSQVLNKNVIPSITPFEDWNKQFLAETPSMTFSDRAIQKVKQAGYEGAQIQTGVLESVQKMGINLKRGVEDIINAPQYYLGKAFGPTWVQEAIDRTELEKQAVREATDARVGTLFGLGDLVGGSNVKGKPENILELVKLQQEEGKYKGTLKDFLNDKEGLLTGRGRGP